MSAELARITDPAQIAALPVEQRGVVITQALEESKSWLAVATKGTDPTPIAEFRAWAATVAEMTRQKGLAEDIQLDALEMVRRAEHGIGEATRNGQDSGEIRKPGEGAGRPPKSHLTQSRFPQGSPAKYFHSSQQRSDIYAMTDGVTAQEFEAAIADARGERNLSRANVVRKVAQQVQRESALAQGAAFIAELNRNTTPQAAAWAADEHRRRGAALSVINPCEQLVKTVRDPELAASEMPDDYQQHAPTVRAALDLLARFVAALESR